MPDFSSPRVQFALGGSLLLVLLTVIFALQNTEPIRVNLIFFSTEGSAALVLLLTFMIGIGVGLLVMVPVRLRDRKRIKKLRGEVQELATSRSSADASKHE